MKVKYTKENTKKTKKRKKSKLGIILIFMLTIGLTFFILLKTVLFPIEKIVVKGDSIYTTEEIITSSAVNKGDKLFGVSQNKVNELLSVKLPYIKEAKISRELPGTLTITVTPLKAAFSIAHNNQYVIVADNYKFLNQAVEPQKDTITVKGAEITTNKKGYEISFKNEEKKESFLNLIKYITKYEIAVKATDVSNLAQLKATVQNGIEVNFGTVEDIDYKIQYLKGMLKNIDKNSKGTIDLSYWTRSNPKGYYDSTEN